MRGGELILTKLASLAAPLRGEDRQFRRAGDEARDRKDWTAAAELYRLHLEAEPKDVPIWVQLGHALKEQGQVSDALQAYRRAAELGPEDGDAQLQFGRALILAGRRGEAAESLANALRLEASADAYRELVMLGESQLASELMGHWTEQELATATLMEVTDLLVYLNEHRTLSGIQRVQANIIEQVLALPKDQLCGYRFVISSPEGCMMLENNTLSQLVSHAAGTRVEQRRLKELVAELRTTAILIPPASTQTLLILGAFWNVREVVQTCARMRELGLRVGLYIYDLIPITHPEFCAPLLSVWFTLAIGDGLRCFDFLFAISDYVANDVRRLLAENGITDIGVEAVPLAHVLKPVKRLTAGYNAQWDGKIAHLRDRRFVLSVSTIEARKNHAYLFRIWRELLSQGEDMPDLVFIGRQGWRVDELMDQIRDTNHLDGRLHVLHDLSDEDLATLYQNCLFTAFPSFCEGWGLPVGESLTYGVPCVASNATSIPEVGQDLVDYVDPLNIRDGITVMRRMLFESGYLEKRRMDIRTRFQARTWHDVGRDLLAALQRQKEKPSRGACAAVALMPGGQTFRPADYSRSHGMPSNYIATPLRSTLVEGWSDCESIGAWMTGKSARAAFYTGLRTGRVIVYLQLFGAPTANGQVVTVAPAGVRPMATSYGPSDLRVGSMAAQPWVTKVLRLRIPVSADGLVDLRFTLDRPALSLGEHDPRQAAFGVRQIGWAAEADAAGRQNIVEQLLFESM